MCSSNDSHVPNLESGDPMERHVLEVDFGGQWRAKPRRAKYGPAFLNDPKAPLWTSLSLNNFKNYTTSFFIIDQSHFSMVGK